LSPKGGLSHRFGCKDIITLRSYLFGGNRKNIFRKCLLVISASKI
jgi:hypothetical protein